MHTGNTPVIPALRQPLVVGIERKSEVNRSYRAGNQWLVGQKADAIREANEADLKSAEPAAVQRQ